MHHIRIITSSVTVYLTELFLTPILRLGEKLERFNYD